MVAATFDRVAERAATFQPAKVALSVLAAPFYLIGLLIGIVWVGLAWAYAAVLVGLSDARSRRKVSADGAI